MYRERILRERCVCQIHWIQPPTLIRTPIACETRANRLFRLSRILPGQVLQTFMHSVLCGAHSASLVNPYQTIPPEEYLGFLDGLPKVGAALAEYEGRDKQKTRPPKWPGEVRSGAGSG